MNEVEPRAPFILFQDMRKARKKAGEKGTVQAEERALKCDSTESGRNLG